MKKYYFQHLFLFCALFLVGCNSYPDTPENVVERYTNYLNAGACENAKEYCYGNAMETINGMIDAGCEPTNIIVDSIKCEIRDTNCVCSSYEKHPIMGDRVVYYHLALDSNKWKLDNLLKDSNGPWSWWDYGHDLFDSGKDEFENPIQVINLIFNNYIKYDKGIESKDDVEAMEKCLKQLGSDLSEGDLIVILDVWMYYNINDFDVKNLTESILKTNKRNSKNAIQIRVKGKHYFEDEKLGPLSKLIFLNKELGEIDQKNEIVDTWIYFNNSMDTISIQFSGKCIYEYPIKQYEDSVFVYFDTIEDCVHRSGVKEFYNLTVGEYPKVGELFIKMKIDSIKSYNEYLFPKWVDSVNSIYKDWNILTSEFVIPNLIPSAFQDNKIDE